MDWFAASLLSWFDQHGRRDLPWQRAISPYRVWVSEIMLQQTQVATVVPYFTRFVDRFPRVEDLAAAEIDDVLHLWTGLGYYARGRNLHKAARQIMREHGGQFPTGVDALTTLPGVGRSTAGAITSIAQNTRAPILDGNVKRVLARFHAVPGYPGDSVPQKALWRHAEDHTPSDRVAHYTQAIMDLGATLCSRQNPACLECPLTERCAAKAADAVVDFPARKAKKPKPVRQARMFVITLPDGSCLLERRPPSGIWGGLWTPPERASDLAQTRLCQELGIACGSVQASRRAPVFRHTFTHYHLDIEPVYVSLKTAPATVHDSERWMWYRSGTNPAIGLAAPAVKLLDSLTDFELT